MTAIHAVLLVPAEGDPLGLLGGLDDEDKYDDNHHPLRPISVPPQVYEHSGRWHPWCPFKRAPYGAQHTYALVLAWDGKVVAECMPWLRRACPMADRSTIRFVMADVSTGYDIELVPGTVRTLWRAMRGAGTLVLLDADGREVTP